MLEHIDASCDQEPEYGMGVREETGASSSFTALTARRRIFTSKSRPKSEMFEPSAPRNQVPVYGQLSIADTRDAGDSSEVLQKRTIGLKAAAKRSVS